MTVAQSVSPPDAADARALGTRLFLSSLAFAELIAAYLGVRLGLYEALASRGPSTPPQLAGRAGTALRYTREWLEQQAVAGMLRVKDAAREPDERVYELPEGHAEALIRPDSQNFVAPLTLLPASGIMGVLPELLDAYRSGAG